MNSVKTISLLIMLLLSVVCGQSVYSMDIFQAEETGDLNRVRELIEQDPAVVDQLNDEKETPLHCAVAHDHIDIIKYLIDKGANVNTQDSYGETPLNCLIHMLMHDGEDDDCVVIIRELIDAGACVDVQDDDLQTPLQYLIMHGVSAEVIEELVLAGANVNVPGPCGGNQLHGSVDTYLEISVAGAQSMRALAKDTAIQCKIIKILIAAGAKLDTKDDNDFTPVQMLEDRMDEYDDEPAIQAYIMDVISLLRDYEQRMLQAEQKAGKIVPALEVALFDQSDNNHSPLAILPGDLCLLKEITGLAKETIFQEAREEVREPRQEDQRWCCKSIFRAAAKGDLDCVKRFIEEDPTIVNSSINFGGLDAEYYPLHYAASAGHIRVVRELIRSGAKVNNDHACDTPLHAAVQKGSLDVVWALIANGADVNATDYSGFTPLHYAIMWPRGHLKIIKALIGGGASLDIRNNDGDTPLGLVRKRQDAEDVFALISILTPVN